MSSGDSIQPYLATAAGLAVLIGIVHSFLGERLIFRKLRDGSFVPDREAPPLSARNVRILWATWHLASVFGWGFAGALGTIALSPKAAPLDVLLHATAAANAGGAMLVLLATRGRHPGWAALAAVATLVWFATRS